jgi:2-haloacid dehalogenase
MKPKAFIFDAYGTLFDVHSVVLRDGNNIPGDLQALSRLWRQKQLEYTWLRSLMERYEDFWDVTEAALRSAVRHLKIEASDVQLDTLMQAYLFPSALPDARPALEALKGEPRWQSSRTVRQDARGGRPPQMVSDLILPEPFLWTE